VDNGWEADGDMVRAAYTLHAEDDDFGQPGALVREVMSEADRNRLVATVSGGLSSGLKPEVLQRALDYWKKIDAGVGKRIEEKVRAKAAPQPAEGMGAR
jgi:catalase